ncbi:MAG TPA: glycosyl hydrolase [Solirubrobacterales bacterium]
MRRRRRAAILATALALTGLWSAGLSANSSIAREIALGSYIPRVTEAPSNIDRYARLMGRQPAIVHYYKQWDFSPFPRGELRAIWNRGSVPMVTWEPQSYHGRSYTLRGIAQGSYDGYVRRAARAAAAWGRPLLLRFAHEMNGAWYPWGAGINGNTGRRYKVAWRRLVRIFRRAGANNVRWVWTPHANQFGHLPFEHFYPGDRWVDWVGLDGFNWGYGGSYYTFANIFERSYRALLRISDKPIMIAETGTYEHRNARWIARAMERQLPLMRGIRAFVWFNNSANGVDVRFNSSRRALRTFRRAARKPRFGLTRDELPGIRRGGGQW